MEMFNKSWFFYELSF